jgi:hypothetical protein
MTFLPPATSVATANALGAQSSTPLVVTATGFAP